MSEKPDKQKQKKEKEKSADKDDDSKKKQKDQKPAKQDKQQQKPAEEKSETGGEEPLILELPPTLPPPPAPVAPPVDDQLCVHHGQPLQFFCQSCEEPICNRCTIIGPHNNQLHRINKIDDSFKLRISKLGESIQLNLLEKRDQLLAQIHRIQYRMEEIKYVKLIVERDIRAEYGGMLERLQSAEGIQIAVLQHQMAQLQKDCDMINDLGAMFNQFTRGGSDQINFLLRSRNLYENIEYLVAKPFQVNIEVYPYDLPRELSEIRVQLQKVQTMQQLLDFKDEVIWNMLEKKKLSEEKLKNDFEGQYYQEIEQWAELTDKYSKELTQFQMVCFYCGVGLDEKTVNQKCKANSKEQLQKGFVGFCEAIPDKKVHGSKRHFFGKPIRKGAEFTQSDTLKFGNLNGTSQKATRNGNDFGQGITQFVLGILSRMRKVQTDQNLDVGQIFKDHEKGVKGRLNYIQFGYIMTELFEETPIDTDKLIRFLDPLNTNSINYEEVLQLLNDPSYIDGLVQNQRPLDESVLSEDK